MKRLAVIPCILISCILIAQTSLEVEGDIQLGSNGNASPDPGTIRWDGSDFVGWNGVIWVSLTGGKSVGMVRDSENNEYSTISIGEQEWMTESLKVTQYRDRTEVVLAESDGDWQKQNLIAAPAYCWPDNNSNIVDDYGLLYNGYVIDAVVNGGKRICPVGWRLPQSLDFNILSNYLGGNSIAGKRLKEEGTTFWTSSVNANPDNESGFSARGTGYRFSDQIFYSFKELNFIWTMTSDNGGYTYAKLEYTSDELMIVSGGVGSIGAGHSIRCIKEN